MTLDEALETWINGNRKDAASWLAKHGRSDTIRFVTALVEHWNGACRVTDLRTLCTLLDSAAVEDHRCTRCRRIHAETKPICPDCAR